MCAVNPTIAPIGESPIAQILIIRGIGGIGRHQGLKIPCFISVPVQVRYPAPYATVENWHIILTQNQAFMGSTPICSTKLGLTVYYFHKTQASMWY